MKLVCFSHKLGLFNCILSGIFASFKTLGTEQLPWNKTGGPLFKKFENHWYNTTLFSMTLSDFNSFQDYFSHCKPANEQCIKMMHRLPTELYWNDQNLCMSRSPRVITLHYIRYFENVPGITTRSTVARCTLQNPDKTVKLDTL